MINIATIGLNRVNKVKIKFGLPSPSIGLVFSINTKTAPWIIPKTDHKTYITPIIKRTVNVELRRELKNFMTVDSGVIYCAKINAPPETKTDAINKPISAPKIIASSIYI